MTDFTVGVEPRSTVGARAARRLRKDGAVPSVVYARGESAVSCQVLSKDFIQTASKAKISTVFHLKSSDTKLDGRLAIVKEIQRNHLDGKLLHIDFQALHENEEIVVQIPLTVVGEAPGVKLDGGILTISAHEVSLSCLPKAIPASLDVDVSELRLGKSLHAEDLKLPDGARLAGNPHETIVSVVAVRQVVEEVVGATDAAAPTADAAAPTATPEAGAKPAEATKGAKGK